MKRTHFNSVLCSEVLNVCYLVEYCHDYIKSFVAKWGKICLISLICGPKVCCGIWYCMSWQTFWAWKFMCLREVVLIYMEYTVYRSGALVWCKHDECIKWRSCPFNNISGKEDGKSCQKVTVRMTIRKNDCRSNRPVCYPFRCFPSQKQSSTQRNLSVTLLPALCLILQVNIVSCDGKCPSASIYNYNINTYARFCKCCREMGLQRRTVQLYCSGNSTWVNYSIQEPTDCSCQWS